VRAKTLATALLAAALVALSACGGGPKHKVAFHDGEKIIKTVNSPEGSPIEAYIPEKEGREFMGWYLTPALTRPYDESQPVTGPMDLYAGFSQTVEDTREFYIVGSGKSALLRTSDWGKATDEDHKLAKGPGNTYSITLDLLEGDEFQLATNSSWHNKRGFGYLKGASLPDGSEAFSGGGGIGDTNPKGSNIQVRTPGNYTLTLKTYPADDTYDTSNANYSEAEKDVFNIGTYDYIDWARNGDPVEKLEVVEDFYIKGAKITSWQDVYDDSTRFVNEGGVYTLKVELEEGDEFMFTSTNTVNGEVSAGSNYIRFNNLDEAGKELFGSNSSNLVAKKSGLHTFVYTPEDGVLRASVE
jgi:hypothetical protein